MNSGDIKISENLLRHLWNKKYLTTNKFTATSGEVIEVLKYGKLHSGFGPDFRNAKIKINNLTFNGNVEFHRLVENWQEHFHDENKQFNTTILHVAMEGQKNIFVKTENKRQVPTIILNKYLAEPLENLIEYLQRDERKNIFTQIPCYTLNDKIDSETINNMILKLAEERVQIKASQMNEELNFWNDKYFARSQIKHPHNTQKDVLPYNSTNEKSNLLNKSIIWQDLLFYNLCDALGFSQNRIPMKKLAEAVHPSLFEFEKNNFTATDYQALLIYASSLKPKNFRDQQSKILWHTLKQSLKQIIKFCGSKKIPENIWLTMPTRPANNPLIRIVAASYLLEKIINADLLKQIITSVEKNEISKIFFVLDELVKLPYDTYWSNYWSFNVPSLKSHSLLGKSRRLDIIVNIIIPLIFLYSKIFKKENMRQKIFEFFKTLPVMEDNYILRKMNKQLIKGKFKLTTAFQQQSIQQLHENYCVKEKCEMCDIGQKVFNIAK